MGTFIMIATFLFVGYCFYRGTDNSDYEKED